MKVRKLIRVAIVTITLVVGGVAMSQSPALAARASGVNGGISG